ncbi:MAG: hypothetical protein ACODAQ_09805 [Phycisphaeraceae bacterium]
MATEWTLREKRLVWGCTGALAVTILVCGGLGIAGYGELRKIMNHKAVYAGRVEFFGEADGWFGTVYDRMILWDPHQTPPTGAPSVELHIDGGVYDARSLTRGDLRRLGASQHTAGQLLDPQGQRLQLSLGGRRSYVLLESGAPPAAGTVGVTAQPIEVSIDGGQPFTLPITYDDLKRFGGQPDDAFSWLHN